MLVISRIMVAWQLLTGHAIIEARLCLVHSVSQWFSLQDTNKVLAISRIMVAWQPLGLSMGCYDMCNRYLQQRHQFGSPLAAFQVTSHC